MGNGFRYWSWTLFYTSDLESKERIIQEFAKSFTLYTVYGKEVCPKTKKTHLQGYFVFKNQHELRWIKRRTFNDIHAEPSRRSAIANTKYCEKDGDVWKYQAEGYDPTKYQTKAKNERYSIALESARKGEFDEIDPEIYIKYQAQLQKIWMEQVPVDKLRLGNDFHNHNIWLYGKSNVGKSYRARKIHEKLKYFFDDFYKYHPDFKFHFNKDLYYKLRSKWWDHYTHESIILIEEIDPDSAKFMAQNIKAWTDQYPFTVEVKQNTIKCIRPLIFIFTSNYSMQECFPNPSDLEPLKRRIKEVHIIDRDQELLWPNKDNLCAELLTTDFRQEEFENQCKREYLKEFKNVNWFPKLLKPGDRPTSFAEIMDKSKNKDKEPIVIPSGKVSEDKTITIPDDESSPAAEITNANNTPSDALLPSMDSLINNGCNSLGSVIDDIVLNDDSEDEFFRELSSLVEGNEKAVQKLNAYTELKKAQLKDVENRRPRIFSDITNKENDPKRKGKDISSSEKEFKKLKKNFL